MHVNHQREKLLQITQTIVLHQHGGGGRPIHLVSKFPKDTSGTSVLNFASMFTSLQCRFYIHRVPPKNVTTFSTITLTLNVRLQ